MTAFFLFEATQIGKQWGIVKKSKLQELELICLIAVITFGLLCTLLTLIDILSKKE